MDLLALFRKTDRHEHQEDGCLAFASELEDGTVVCGMDYEVEEGEVV